jgi:hypothetical protein
VVIKDPVTHHGISMVLYHKYDAQIKIDQFCKFQKALFIKILSNLTFNVTKGGNTNLLTKSKSIFSIRNKCNILMMTYNAFEHLQYIIYIFFDVWKLFDKHNYIIHQYYFRKVWYTISITTYWYLMQNCGCACECKPSVVCII